MATLNSTTKLLQLICVFLPLAVYLNILLNKAFASYQNNNSNLYRIIWFILQISHPLLSIIRASPMSSLTKGQQYSRIAFLGVSFMIMFTSFNSLQNIVSKLYDEYHYDNMGQTAIMCIYGVFGITSLFSSFIVKSLGYKKSMFFSAISYAIFEASGLIIVLELDVPVPLVWIAVCVGAMICGMGASILWVAQGAYTSEVASPQRKSELFGLFWGLMMSSQIFGNLLTTFVLGHLSNVVYFMLLIILGGSSSLLFLFLPNVQSNAHEEQQQEKEKATVSAELSKVMAIIKDKRNRYINIYFLFPGLTVSFYAGFLYKLVKASVPQDDGQSDQDYNHRLNFAEGLVFLALGLSQVVTGFLMNRFSERFCAFRLTTIGTLLVQVAGFTSLICYFTNSFPLCFICAYLWGTCENYLQTNTGAIISKAFPGKVQAFSVYRIFFGLGIVAVLLLNIFLSSYPNYIFLAIVLIFQTFITGISLKLKQLDNEDQAKASLITNNNKLGSEQ